MVLQHMLTTISRATGMPKVMANTHVFHFHSSMATSSFSSTELYFCTSFPHIEPEFLMMRLIWGVEGLRAPCPQCKARRAFSFFSLRILPKEAASPASTRFPAVGGQGKGATGRRVPRGWGRREDGDEEQPGRIEEEEESPRGAKMGGAAA